MTVVCKPPEPPGSEQQEIYSHTHENSIRHRKAETLSQGTAGISTYPADKGAVGFGNYLVPTSFYHPSKVRSPNYALVHQTWPCSDFLRAIGAL